MLDTRAGFTVADVARRHRIGEDKVRAFIKAGALEAINTASAECARPRYVILPEALQRFEHQRSARTAPKTPRKRRPIPTVDYYPDAQGGAT